MLVSWLGYLFLFMEIKLNTLTIFLGDIHFSGDSDCDFIMLLRDFHQILFSPFYFYFYWCLRIYDSSEAGSFFYFFCCMHALPKYIPTEVSNIAIIIVITMPKKDIRTKKKRKRNWSSKEVFRVFCYVFRTRKHLCNIQLPKRKRYFSSVESVLFTLTEHGKVIVIDLKMKKKGFFRISLL